MNVGTHAFQCGFELIYNNETINTFPNKPTSTTDATHCTIESITRAMHKAKAHGHHLFVQRLGCTAQNVANCTIHFQLSLPTASTRSDAVAIHLSRCTLGYGFASISNQRTIVLHISHIMVSSTPFAPPFKHCTLILFDRNKICFALVNFTLRLRSDTSTRWD